MIDVRTREVTWIPYCKTSHMNGSHFPGPFQNDPLRVEPVIEVGAVLFGPVGGVEDAVVVEEVGGLGVAGGGGVLPDDPADVGHQSGGKQWVLNIG